MDAAALIQRWQKLSEHIQSLAMHDVAAREPIKLLAVSKYASSEAIHVLFQAGQLDFAENYLQAALKKMAVLADLPIVWHFIGNLQSNKCAVIAKHFSWVHSLASPKHALLLAQARQHVTPLQVCVQINLSDDEHKYGMSPEAASALVEAVLQLPALQLRGLMVLPKAGGVADFTKLAQLRDQLETQFSIFLPTLSMGMSADYPEAIAAGATLVRIGSSLFQ